MKFHNFIREQEGWKTIETTERFANPYLQVFSVQTATPTRPEGCEWTVAHRKGAAVVAPMTAEGKFILVRQERVPIKASLWEFPAGQIDESQEHDDELIRTTALRELREEAGCQLAPGGELISLGYFFPSAGFTDEHSYLFLGRPVVPHAEGKSPDEHEAITDCRAFTLEELQRMIAENEVRDANTLSLYARLCATGLL